MRGNTVPAFALCATLLIVACSQSRERTQQSTAATAAGDTAAAKPAPFDKGPVKIALVQYSGAGDYFQLWTKGAKQQADGQVPLSPPPKELTRAAKLVASR